MKYYCVSDIHSYYSLLIDSLTESGFFDDKEPHKLVILGDFFDRGAEAKEMEKFLMDHIKLDDVILIRGNHEDLIEEFIENIDLYAFRIKESHHFRNSTVDTVCQLTNTSLHDCRYNRNLVVDRINNTDLFKTILGKCVDYYETKNHIFVHGWIPCFVDEEYGRDDTFKFDPEWKQASKYRWEHARWYNGMRAHNCGVKIDGKTIVCGHWHSSWGHHYIQNTSDEFGLMADFSPYYNDGIICIDGCVPRSFHVNCIVIEDEEI